MSFFFFQMLLADLILKFPFSKIWNVKMELLLKKSGSPQNTSKASLVHLPFLLDAIWPTLLPTLHNVSEKNKMFWEVCSVNSTLWNNFKKGLMSIHKHLLCDCNKGHSCKQFTVNYLINNCWNKRYAGFFLCVYIPRTPPFPAKKGLLTNCRRTCSQMFLIQLNILIGNIINYMYRPVSTIFNRSNMSSVWNKMKT